MSNHLAVAAVTATLRRFLQSTVAADVTGADATALRPDAPANTLPSPGVNIYLYQVVPNPAWRVADLPTRDPGGNVLQRPRIPLDLRYLLTFYGDDAALEAQRVLGSTVRALHARPVLTRDQILATITDPAFAYVADADLAHEIERVKLAPLAFTLEELSQLWSMLSETPYVLSMVYQASVVLLEAADTPRRALPVRERMIAVSPFQRAAIERSVAADDPAAPIVFGGTAAIEGSALDGTIARIRVGVADLAPVADAVRAARVLVALDDPALRAGIQGVQIVYASGAESTVGALVLRPDITVDAGGVTATEIPVEFAPAVGRDQRVILHLNELAPPDVRLARAYSFDAPPANGIADPDVTETAAITFAVAGVVAGEYLVRVQVAGAESVLEVGEVAGQVQYRAPVVTMP